MAQLTRFGRRLALPSTRQIKHELLLVGIHEDARLKAIADKKAADEASAPAVTPAS